MRYPGLIKLFNRKDGELCPPRHADGMDAKMPEGFDDFITPEMLLSVHLKENCDPLPMLFELTRVVTAIALDRPPACIEPDLPMEEKFNRMAAENEKYAASLAKCKANPQAMTETGMIRRCLVSFLCTLSTAPNTRTAEQRAALREKYPFLERHPWDLFRSLHYNATPTYHPIATQSCRNFWNHLTTSAPFAIHLLITRLYKLGVISWIQGAYEDVAWSSAASGTQPSGSSSDMKFHLNGETANGLIAPRSLTETTDALSASVLQQAMKPVAGNGNAVYQKGRTLLSPSGETIHVMELGIPGHAGIFDGKVLRRVQWLDTHSYESAQQLMPCVVGVVGIIEGMLSRSVARPFEVLNRYYEAVLPKRQDFARQCDKMMEHYQQLSEFLEYARLVEEAYPERFGEKMRQGIDIKSRQRIISEINQTRGYKCSLRRAHVGRDEESASDSDRFIPVTQRSFEKMTPDFSLDQVRKIRGIWARETGHAGPNYYYRPAKDTPALPGLLRSFASQGCVEPNAIVLSFNHGLSDIKKYEIATVSVGWKVPALGMLSFLPVIGLYIILRYSVPSFE
ncbi:hypothetical protein ABW21_db0205916 [Orbilia brochopaga]|nr:hypothetical protein ABW21_db0205916 [Drechslerella brochopaga]